MQSKQEEIRKWHDYYVSNKNKKNEEIRVAFYARVSTEHEAQLSAFENQESWCLDILRFHENWHLYKIFKDRGVTGTQVKHRAGFMNAIEEGKKEKYDLLVVRDVSRFARNCEESLKYTRILKKHGVEVFFYNDGIWSMDADGDLRLGLMSTLAQDESRRISEKVLAGQYVSRQKGVLYGSGNILGYRLVRGVSSSDNTYEIIEEDAETVRMIFDLYVNKGMGIKKISSTLIERHRKNASGIVRWDAGKVSRILDNRTYSSYIGYRKSQCVDFLEHTRVKTDKSQHIYVKGNFPEIISDEMWQEAQRIKKKNSIIVQDKIKCGKKPAREKWVKKLHCACGSSYKRYKWRTNQSGEEVFGYQCNNQVLNRKRSFVVRQGLDGIGYCDVPSIAMWKLEFQLQLILKKIWENPKKTIERLVSNIAENYVEAEQTKVVYDIERRIREKNRLESRLKNLMDMRLDGDIDKETFAEKKTEITTRLLDVEQEIRKHNCKEEHSVEADNKAVSIAKIQDALEKTANIDGKFLDEGLVDQVVERVVPYEDGTFKWYLNVGIGTSEQFSENDYVKYLDFDVGFDEAKTYRKRFNNFIRARQWKDIHVQVYIRI